MEALTFKQHVKCMLLHKFMYEASFNEITVEQLGKIKFIANKLADEPEDVQCRSSFSLDTPLEDCELSVRTFRCLNYAQIQTVRDLIQCTELDLMRIRNFGKSSLREIRNFLKEHNLQMKGRMI